MNPGPKVNILRGSLAGFHAHLIRDNGSSLFLVVDVFGRPTELSIPTADTDYRASTVGSVSPRYFPEAVKELKEWIRRQQPRYFHNRISPPETHCAHIMDCAVNTAVDVGEYVHFYKEFGIAEIGTDDSMAFYRGYALTSAEESAESSRVNTELQMSGQYAKNEVWRTEWLPIMHSIDGKCLCIDLAGCAGGTPGQIIEWHPDSRVRWILAPGFGPWMGLVVEAIGRHILVWSDDAAGIEVADGCLNDFHNLQAMLFPDSPRHFETKHEDAVPAEG